MDIEESPFKKFNPTIDDVVEGLKTNKFKKIVVACGAGISVAAGIPDFRTPGSGLYYNLQKYGLPFPEAIFDIVYFLKNPRPFFHLAREMWPQPNGPYKPTAAHRFIKKLHDKGLLLRCFTQNIDGLEQLTGLPEDKIVAAHGNFYSASCVAEPKKVEVEVEVERISPSGLETESETPKTEKIKEIQTKYIVCHKHLTQEEYDSFKNQVLNPKKVKISKKELKKIKDEAYEAVKDFKPPEKEGNENSEKTEKPPEIVEESEDGDETVEDFEFPTCPHCGGLCKPDITFFGESLPKRFFERVMPDLSECDLLLVVGTSLEVYPFACIVDRTKSNTPRVLINRDAVGPFAKSENLDEKNTTNVIALGEIEEIFKKIEKELGWEDKTEKVSKISKKIEKNGIISKKVEKNSNISEKTGKVTKKIEKTGIATKKVEKIEKNVTFSKKAEKTVENHSKIEKKVENHSNIPEKPEKLEKKKEKTEKTEEKKIISSPPKKTEPNSPTKPEKKQNPAPTSNPKPFSLKKPKS